MKTTEISNGSVPPVSDDPALYASTKTFLTALNGAGGPPLESLPYTKAREVLIGAQASVSVDLSGIKENEHVILVDGFSIKLNVVKPADAEDMLPVFLFIHGGGWVLGDYPTHQRMVRDLVVLSGAAGVFINYTPSPDVQFPQQPQEIYAATRWVAENGAEIGVDGKRLALVGNSAGGNMATVTALRAALENGPKIKLQILFWPTVNSNFDTTSYKRFGKERFLTEPLIRWMYDTYLPNSGDRTNIYAAPLLATLEQLKDLPPTLIQVGEADIFLDESLEYGRKLDAAGVQVATLTYAGAIHDFGLLNALAETPTTKALFRHAAAELKAFLF
jgi:acetyl esterase